MITRDVLHDCASKTGRGSLTMTRLSRGRMSRSRRVQRPADSGHDYIQTWSWIAAVAVVVFTGQYWV